MWRACALVAVLLLMAGCAADGEKHWYDEALKDLRGDNQQMRGFSSTRSADGMSDNP
jgi:hypothetical protein